MITTTKTITWQVLIPAEGHKLVNYDEKIISERVESINPQGWEEITEEEAEELQSQWDYERDKELQEPKNNEDNK